MHQRLAILALVFVAAAPAAAAETPWQNVAPGVSVRLISAGTLSPNGDALFALEIDMPEGTKTYWRVPGEAGLPINLDLTESKGVDAHEVLWPYPLRELKDDLLDYVYYGHTVLPLEVTASDPKGTLDIFATLGICSEICVPAQVRLSLPLSDVGPDAANGLRIRQALAEVPIDWTEGDNPIGEVSLVPELDAIAVTVDPDQVDETSVIAATTEGAPVFGAPQKSPQTNLVVLPILGKSDNSALEGVDVEVTFMTDMGAYVVNRTIEAGETTDAASLGQ